MARANLGALLGNVDDTTSSIPAPKPGQAPVPVAAAEPPAIPKAAPRATRPATPKSVDPDLSAAYLRFVRKETRLREEQQNLLTQHARRLNRAKGPGAARITDNTLIRVAVDLLLARIDTASGDDEATILKSLNQ